MTKCVDKRVLQDALIERISQLNADGEKAIPVARELIRFKRFVDGLTPTVSQWIPCSERLPEPYKDVLACWRDIRKGCDDDYCMVTSWIEHGRWNSVADFVDMQVIAWMPLPEPYKEEY